ncbi:MAG TPA: nitroreductase/quinone reductase family protein [Anaerolineales bacterium]
MILDVHSAFLRWLYRGGHPSPLAKIMNKGGAIFNLLGLLPNYSVTLEVVGRQSGKKISFPLVMVMMNGERYLVSMLGKRANWVLNVKAANGKAMLRHGANEQVLLKEIAVEQRAPILKEYLQIAPGARPHIPISKDAPISEFEKISSKYPVFKLETINAE